MRRRCIDFSLILVLVLYNCCAIAEERSPERQDLRKIADLLRIDISAMSDQGDWMAIRVSADRFSGMRTLKNQEQGIGAGRLFSDPKFTGTWSVLGHTGDRIENVGGAFEFEATPAQERAMQHIAKKHLIPWTAGGVVICRYVAGDDAIMDFANQYCIPEEQVSDFLAAVHLWRETDQPGADNEARWKKLLEEPAENIFIQLEQFSRKTRMNDGAEKVRAELTAIAKDKPGLLLATIMASVVRKPKLSADDRIAILRDMADAAPDGKRPWIAMGLAAIPLVDPRDDQTIHGFFKLENGRQRERILNEDVLGGLPSTALIILNHYADPNFVPARP